MHQQSSIANLNCLSQGRIGPRISGLVAVPVLFRASGKQWGGGVKKRKLNFGGCRKQGGFAAEGGGAGGGGQRIYLKIIPRCTMFLPQTIPPPPPGVSAEGAWVGGRMG